VVSLALNLGFSLSKGLSCEVPDRREWEAEALSAAEGMETTFMGVELL
jgi:hypothetical protein